jgi:predicted metal-dependent hydrolase
MQCSGDHDPRDATDTPIAADSAETDATFERGLMLFNSGDFFACHEVWEEL